MALVGFRAGVEAVKESFFDRDKVLRSLDQAEAKALSKMGAFVRSDAIQSMKRSKSGKPSPPGKPPRAHVGHLRKFLYFSYDKRAHDVVIGPVRLQRTRYAVPGLLEHGGSVTNRFGNVIKHPARPYMQPALQKNLDKGMEEWRDSLR